MKQLVFKTLLMLIAAMTSLTATAEFSVDGLRYQILSEEDCTVRFYGGTGGYYSGDIQIPEVVQYDDKTYTVTEIDAMAFCNCESLMSVVMPNSISEVINPFESFGIGHDFNGGFGVFMNCSSLRNVVLSKKLTYIDTYMFYGCSSLENIDLPNGVISIEKGAFYGCSYLESIKMPDDLTSIGDRAFYGCGYLESVELPEGLTSMGMEAFYGCSSLVNVEFLDASLTSIGDRTFYGCNSLGSAELPNDLILIGVDAFRGCSSLGSVELPEGLTSIGERAFYGCSSLRCVKLPNSLTIIPTGTFYQTGLTSVKFPEALIEVKDSAFYGADLENITLPSSIEYVRKGAFRSNPLSRVYCLNTIPPKCYDTSFPSDVELYVPEGTGETYRAWDDASYFSEIKEFSTEGANNFDFEVIDEKGGTAKVTAVRNKSKKDISIPEFVILDGNVYTVAEIGDMSFADSEVETVYIPETVTTIGEKAFYNCRNLETINLPVSLSVINAQAFMNCTFLVNINVPDRLTGIGEQAFRNCSSLISFNIPSSVGVIDAYAFAGCESLTDIGAIPENLRTLGDYAFYDCKQLTTPIKLGSSYYYSIRKLGNGIFYGCSSLTDVEIGSNVTAIGDDCFKGCSKIAELEIPGSVENIGAFAFNGCLGLTEVTSENPVPPVCFPNTFPRIAGAVLNVPYGSAQAYKEAPGWANFGVINEIGSSGVNDEAVEKTAVRVIGGSIVVSGVADSSPVVVYDVDGRQVYRGAGDAEIPIAGKGVYVVKIANETFKIIL